MHKLTYIVLASTLLTAAPVYAQTDHGPWHGRDIHRFHEHDFARWRGGHWFHGAHEGRNGWWWTLDGGWYFYPAPVYPYPDPYTPPVVITTPLPVAPVGAPPRYVYYCSNPAGYYPYVAECFTAWQRNSRTVVVTQPPLPEPPLQVVTTPPPVTISPAPPIAVEPPMPLTEAPPLVAPSSNVPAGQIVNFTPSRDQDDRQLNAYAVEFQNVDLKSPKARANLRKLEKKVASFRQVLYTRTYAAMDIVRDADGLEHRIAAQREKLK